MTFTRRAALLGAAAFPAAQQAAGQARDAVVAISSANRNGGGVNCCAKAVEMMKAGADTLDAIIAGVNIVELDPRDSSVGYGGLPNEDGVVELDCSCMHGPTRRGGAVAALRNIKTPSKVAKAVMTESTHMMLAGEGALRFAKAVGFKEEDLLTEEARLQWLTWKKSLRDGDGRNNWNPGPRAEADPQKKAGVLREIREMFPNAGDELLAEAWRNAVRPPHGTINCIARNAQGEMSAITSTSGLAWKIAGRVGDSPIIGGGLWLDQDVGGAGSTGIGEENLRVCGAHTIVENMRRGMTPKDACLEALRRVARNYGNDRRRLAGIDVQFYAMNKDGAYAGASLWNKPSAGSAQGAQFAVCAGDGRGRHEESAYLLER